MNWYFTTEDSKVICRARFESEDGTIGDAREEIGPGDIFYGVAYEDFKKAGAGTLQIDGQKGKISTGPEPEDDLDTTDLADIERLA